MSEPNYEQREKIVEMFGEGKKQIAIGQALNISRERVRQILGDYGISGRNYNWIPSRENITAVLTTADSYPSILQTLGLDERQFNTALLYHKLTAQFKDAKLRWRSQKRNERILAAQRPLINRIRNLAIELGHTPTDEELQNIGLRHMTLRRFFGTALNAMIVAGLLPNRAGCPPSLLPPDFENFTEPCTDRTEVSRRADLIRAMNENVPEPPGVERPRQVSINTTAYYRDPKVVAWILNQANGVCEACGQDGYETDAGVLYLEVHHMLPLSCGGPDTISNAIAVCEACHGKLHRWKNRAELERSLYDRIHRLIRFDVITPDTREYSTGIAPLTIDAKEG